MNINRKIRKKYAGVKIALDFDGTVCKHRYPEIGEELTLGIEWLKNFREEGGRIFLDTMRCRGELEQAIQWCRDRGLEFDGIGCDPQQWRWAPDSRKTFAHLSLDDRNCGTPILIDELGAPYVDWEKLIPIIEYRISLL